LDPLKEDRPISNPSSSSSSGGSGGSGGGGSFNRDRRPDSKNAHLINRQIRASYIRVIGKDGEQLGILDTRQARDLAEGLGLDLVMMSATSDPPVCKIMDYGKFKYEEKKKAQVAKKKQVHVEVKEVQLRPKTDVHDLQHKANSTLKFLEDGNKTKVTVFYRGRELQNLALGWETLQEFAGLLNDQAVIEGGPKMEGKRLWILFAPPPPGKKVTPGALVAQIPSGPPAGYSAPPPPQRRPGTFRR
jgi:translation initiation factor IF-3